MAIAVSQAITARAAKHEIDRIFIEVDTNPKPESFAPWHDVINGHQEPVLKRIN